MQLTGGKFVWACASKMSHAIAWKCGIHTTRVYKKAQSCKYCQMFVQNKWLFYVENGHDLN
jgi:hypothetical protein